jgi:Fe-Mn family superoxide dismutase
MAFTLPELPYDVEALEPYIDGRTMEIHHDKHHGGYVSKLNAALEKAPSLQNRSIEEILGGLESVPGDIRTSVRNNGGGHYNHSLFWKILGPDAGGRPDGSLARSIDRSFGTFEDFRENFTSAAAGLFGSGWAWLIRDSGDRLTITTTPNQDNPVMLGQVPILGLDVWEHAYYLKYQNRRPEYIAAFWAVVDWTQVAENLERASG